jgi:hypothetical protein
LRRDDRRHGRIAGSVTDFTGGDLADHHRAGVYIGRALLAFWSFGHNLSNLIELEPNVIIKQRYFRVLPIELLQSHLRAFGKTSTHFRIKLSSKN